MKEQQQKNQHWNIGGNGMTWHKHTPKWNCISVNGKKRLYKSCPVSYVEVVVVNNNNNKHKHQPNCPFKLRWPIFCSALLSNSPTGTEKEKSLQHFNESIFSFFFPLSLFLLLFRWPVTITRKSCFHLCCLLLLSHRHWFYSRYFFFSNRHTNTNL